jgi:hypothetical protein
MEQTADFGGRTRQGVKQVLLQDAEGCAIHDRDRTEKGGHSR